MTTPALTLPDDWDWQNPDYDRVWETRAKRLNHLRKNPELVPKLWEYYANNPAHFIHDWGVTFDPRLAERGINPVVPFLLFPRQHEFIDWVVERWKMRENGVVEKSRDMGVSWLCVGFAAWMMLFIYGSVVGMGSRKEEYVDKIGDPKSLFWKIRMFINMLPVEFQPKRWNEAKHAPHMRVTNPGMNSFITGEAGDNVGRGNRTALYLVDEFAFFERPDQVDASLSQTTNCRIDVSTPNGAGNPFYRRAHDGKTKKFVFDWRAQPLDALIVTPQGMRKMGDVTVGDEVIGADGKPTTVVNIYPHGMKPVYRVTFSDGSSTESCADHLWEVIPHGNHRAERKHITKTLPLSEIMLDYRRVCSRGYNIHRYQVPMVSNPVEFASERKLPLHPYVLGCLLGDGSLPSKSNTTVAIAIGDGDRVLCDIINEHLPDGCELKNSSGIVYWVSAAGNFRGGVRGRGCHNPVNEAIRSLGLVGTKSDTKFVPEMYKIASPGERLNLLQGLLDTDGSAPIRDPGAARLHTCSQQLADDVVFITQSLGGTATISRIESKGTIARFGTREHVRNHDMLMVRIKLPNGVIPFKLPRKVDRFTSDEVRTRGVRRSIVNIEYVGDKEVQCIEVSADNGLYLTDDFIVTHNCDPRKDEAWYAEQKAKLDPVVLAQEVDRDYTASVANAFIPGNVVTMAARSGAGDLMAYGPIMVGVDVARFGDDKTVITIRRGRVVSQQHVYGKLDVVDCAGMVKKHVMALLEKPAQIAVDTIGIGAGVADILRRDFGNIVVDVNSAVRLNDGEHYNLRARMYADMREWLKAGASIPNDPDLISDLTALQYHYKGGLLLMESKDEAKKRGIKSPDRADSLALTFAEPPKQVDDEFEMPVTDLQSWGVLDTITGY